MLNPSTKKKIQFIGLDLKELEQRFALNKVIDYVRRIDRRFGWQNVEENYKNSASFTEVYRINGNCS